MTPTAKPKALASLSKSTLVDRVFHRPSHDNRATPSATPYPVRGWTIETIRVTLRYKYGTRPGTSMANIIPKMEGLAPAPTSFFMTVRDVAFWIRSAGADARLEKIRMDQQPGSAFDQLYRDTVDPFGAELPQYRYQQRKYASLLSMLPRRRYRNVLDIGCGLGAFVRKIAPFAEHVLGTDISAEAIVQARKLSVVHRNVAFLQRDMVNSSLEETAFDLIVIADTLYYIGARGASDLESMARVVSSKLAPDGLLLIVNHYFFGLDSASRETRAIHDAFRCAPTLECVAEHRRAFFLATLLRRAPP